MTFQTTALCAKLVAAVSAVVLWCVSVTLGFAEETPSHRDAREILEHGDLPRAQKAYEDLAEAGDASAQYVLGMLWDHNLAGVENEEGALDMLRRSIEQGHYHAIRGAAWAGLRSYEDAETTETIRRAAQSGAAWAQTLLGHAYRLGRTVPQDNAQAAVWYAAALDNDKGDSAAAYYLSLIIEEGRGLLRSDANLALQLLRLAAERGHPLAMMDLARRYWNGEGVPRDRVEARHLFRLAAVHKHEEAAAELARQYGEGDGVDANPIEAFNWLRLSRAKSEVLLAQMEELGLAPVPPSDPSREYSGASALARAGQWQEAIALYQTFAEQGDADIMFYLGRIHLEGREVARNERVALDWLQRAAELNEPRAIGVLGDWMLANADNATAVEDAVSLLKHASAYGVNMSAYVLGHAYEHGRGVQQDAVEAVRWYRTASGMKVDYKYSHLETNAKAQYRIGQFFEDGIGVKQDFSIAASEYISAFILLEGVGEWDGLGRAVIKDWMIDESREEAFSAQLAAAQAGDAVGNYLTARRYETGDYVQRDMSAALRHYDEASQKGHSDAQFRLGSILKKGTVVPRDSSRAHELLLLASEQGHADAAGELADSYMAGLGVEIDYESALRWAVFSADHGAASGQTSLGAMHYFGQGLPRDVTEGERLFRLAAEQDYAPAIAVIKLLKIHQ